MLVVTEGVDIPRPEIVPTPSLGINYILGGGLWTGRQHVFWGPSQVGKTTFILHIMAEAQKMGYTPVIIDAEKSLIGPEGHTNWIEHCGIEKPYMYSNNNILEDILKDIMKLMKDGNKYIFLFDSLNSIIMEQFYKEDTSTGAIGIYARTQKVLMQKMANEMTNEHISIMVAQQAMKSGAGSSMVPGGSYGNSVHHWSTNIIKLFSSDAKDNVLSTDADDRILMRKVSWRVDKSKQGPVQGTKGDYYFSPADATIDEAQELFKIAVKNNVIEQKGAWYYYGDEKYHGEVQVLESLTSDRRDEIKAKLLNKELSFDIEEVPDH